MPSPRQIQRQKHRERTGRYAQVFPCYRCGKSAGEDYASYNGDAVDVLGNSWHDTALCLCEKCAAHMQMLSPAWAWAEASSPAWGFMPQGKPAKYLYDGYAVVPADVMAGLLAPMIAAMKAGENKIADALLHEFAGRIKSITSYEVYLLVVTVEKKAKE